MDDAGRVAPTRSSGEELRQGVLTKDKKCVGIGDDKVGRPINKFLRSGLDIKVCVVVDVTEKLPKEIVVDAGEPESAVIAIEAPHVRKYRETTSKKVFVVKNVSQLHPSEAGPSSSGNAPKTLEGVEGEPESGVELSAGGGWQCCQGFS
ncbi:hypothetical protein LINPERPRIM_LOCUS20993 [Linum perenne]